MVAVSETTVERLSTTRGAAALAYPSPTRGSAAITSPASAPPSPAVHERRASSSIVGVRRTSWPNHHTFPALSSAYHRTSTVTRRPCLGTSQRTPVVATPAISRGRGTTLASTPSLLVSVSRR